LARIPKSHREFWVAKLEGNRARDLVNYRELRAMGWKVMVVWECELRNLDEVLRRVTRFLAGPR
jgi:DNA mismatch endonuclease (patch repair protein)